MGELYRTFVKSAMTWKRDRYIVGSGFKYKIVPLGSMFHINDLGHSTNRYLVRSNLFHKHKHITESVQNGFICYSIFGDLYAV